MDIYIFLISFIFRSPLRIFKNSIVNNKQKRNGEKKRGGDTKAERCIRCIRDEDMTANNNSDVSFHRSFAINPLNFFLFFFSIFLSSLFSFFLYLFFLSISLIFALFSRFFLQFPQVCVSFLPQILLAQIFTFSNFRKSTKFVADFLLIFFPD